MFKIEINQKWCKACGMCEGYCPKNVFDFDGEHIPTPTREADCIGCNMCVLRCPDFALEVTKK